MAGEIPTFGETKRFHAHMHMAHSMWPFGTVLQIKGDDQLHARWMLLAPDRAMCLGDLVRGTVIELSAASLALLEPAPEPEF